MNAFFCLKDEFEVDFCQWETVPQRRNYQTKTPNYSLSSSQNTVT